MKSINLALGSVTVGILAGVVICSGQIKDDFTKFVGIAALAALPASFITYLIVDTKAQKKIEESDKYYQASADNLMKTLNQLDTVKKQNTGLVNELAELETTKQALNDAVKAFGQLKNQLTTIQQRLQELESKGKFDDTQITKLEDEIKQWETHFQQLLDQETSKRLVIARKTEIDKIFQEHDQITGEAMNLYRELASWGEKIADGHSQKREIITSLAANYNTHLDEVGTAIETERNNYLEQIELLNMRVGRLQKELSGELVEPGYGDFGFDVNGRIANELARLLFQDLQLPLAVKGICQHSTGVVDVGFGYSRSHTPENVVKAISQYSEMLGKKLGIHKITSVRKLDVADVVVVSFRQSPVVNDKDADLMVGSPQEFIDYVVSNPIRYRLIADPGAGKTPTTAVMISEILKSGCRRGNTAKGAKVPNTLVTFSYPGVASSLKDSDYPLDLFLKYGDTTAAIKSFKDAVTDWEYRKQYPAYASEFFQIWGWDELDNTLNSASDVGECVDNLKQILKQAGHNNVGWVVSGQSVMTRQIPGFTNDDRSLFTEIVIGIPKIRLYLNTYGKGKNSESNLAKLTKNLDALEEYIEHKNQLVTDDARLLRVALIVDSRSPKLYFLPNLDSVKFDIQAIEETRGKSENFKSGLSGLTKDRQKTVTAESIDIEGLDQSSLASPKLPIEGAVQSGLLPHCPHCNSSNVSTKGINQYQCKDCGKRTANSKIVWK
ncbi:hypothetical protein FJR11_22450 [Anabaena sp. UHCC 0187]|uniref:hypothetical protein n=1 Tax=Anabaena sp. UHCC 0187 TaxID=2590018 RepID=UPI001447DA30|nr:hypothetical protein [Anabaena sp. UHCC 0187]MTJ15272.1 hypothetical protein [Anabaena sp. UHCC 0187]